MSHKNTTDQPVQDAPRTLAGGRVKVLDWETIWRGFVHLSRCTVEIPTFRGGRMTQVREIHDHGSATVVLPVDRTRRTALLIRQWRIPPLLRGDTEPLLEVVAGIIDPGETPEQTARREVLEETGYEVDDIEKIAEGYSSPGTMTEYFYLFAATYHADGRRHDGGGLDHESEDIEVVEFSFDELRALSENGGIRDAKTIIAVNWLLAGEAAQAAS